jgi:hypothetical protein
MIEPAGFVATVTDAEGSTPLFSTDRFLRIAATSVYRGRAPSELVRHGRHTYRVLMAGADVVNLPFEFPSYYEPLSTSVQGRPVAHIPLVADAVLPAGQSWPGRFYYRLPAYDVEFGRYSPGRVLLRNLILAAYDEGATEFDFLLGGEPYKWDFATHTRILRAAGRPSRSARLRWRADSVLRAHPAVGRPVRALAVRARLARPVSE